MADEPVVEKTSRWSEAERAAESPTGAPTPDARPPLPAWLGTFAPGSTFTHDGWECAVRHIGYEGGMWMMLVQPLTYKEPRSVSRSEFRRLRTQVGKKKASEILKSRGQTVPVTQEEYDDASFDNPGSVDPVRPDGEGPFRVDRPDSPSGDTP